MLVLKFYGPKWGGRGTSALFRGLKETTGDSGLIVYPTETYYALGARADSRKGISRVYKVKKRAHKMPLSIAISSVDDIETYAIVTPDAQLLIDEFLPGPLTVVLKNRGILRGVIGKKLALRVPNHPVALKLLAELGPLTATSANIHGNISPRTCRAAILQLGCSVDAYIDGGQCRLSKSSTIVDLSGTRPAILREGAIPSYKIMEAMNAT